MGREPRFPAAEGFGDEILPILRLPSVRRSRIHAEFLRVGGRGAGPLENSTEDPMHDTTTSLTDLLTQLQECLKDNDCDAASFLREGVFECVRIQGAWLSDKEYSLLKSF